MYLEGRDNVHEENRRLNEVKRGIKQSWKEMLWIREHMEREIGHLEGLRLPQWTPEVPADSSDGTMNAAPPTFCTPECLLGLELGNKPDLDVNCPNVGSHQRGLSGKHRVLRAQLGQLIRDQLRREQNNHKNLWFCGDGLPGQPGKSRLRFNRMATLLW